MSTASVIVSIDAACADRESIARRLRLITRLRRLTDAEEIGCNVRLAELAADDPSVSPEHVNAAATGRSLRAANRSIGRADAAGRSPVIHEAVAQGVLSAEHLEAFDVAVRSLAKRLRHLLLEQQHHFAAIGAALTVEEFRDRLAAEVRRLEGDDGAGRLERQRRRIGARSWTDRDGMWCLSGRFDPERALPLAEAWRRTAEAIFRGELPADAPDDPVLRHDYVQALALAALILGDGVGRRGGGDPEIIVVCDERTICSGRHAGTRIDWGHALDLPIASLQAIAGRARFVPVVVDRDGVVIAQGRPVPDLAQLAESLRNPVALDHGRRRRHASAHQRRALRAMYRRCAIPGCDRHVSRCEAHHVDAWAHGGVTDLARLIPICPHHHDRLHAERWELELRPDRTLIVRRDGAVIMSTGPPCEQWA